MLLLAERGVAVLILAAAAAPLSCVLLAVRVLSRRAPLVAHRRMGLNGEAFWVLKIRTMWTSASPGKSQATQQVRACSADEQTCDQDRLSNAVYPRPWIEYLTNTDVPDHKTADDPRVTSAFARFCRRYSIDEFPQLLHVLGGKMRLAGPRPLTSRELNVYYGDAAAEVLSIPPGITGLWQVMGRSRLSYPQRRRLDLFFVRHSSWRLYLKVLLQTPLCVLTGRGAR
jgi:exopolysaccharide production protein ExoY